MLDKDVSKAVQQRKNRMSRRRFERRFKRGVVGVGVLYALALIVAPERTTLPSAPQSFAALPSFTQLPPAANVVRRKPATVFLKVAQPWSVDTVQNVPRKTLTRWHSIYGFSRKYNVNSDLAAKIYDAALQQKIEPDLGFRLVAAESEFKTRAASPVGAIGLTQLMLGTARGFEPNVTREDLMQPETNLRIGFRYLRALIRENDGNLSLALLTYNRGPVAVQLALSQGRNPTNGYDTAVTKGYRGRGVLD
ncbi:MAG: transglycosylase SLT domain-containing protein [Gemmatimonadaceae bacterium]